MVAVALLSAVALALVGLSLRRPELPEYPPTPPGGAGEQGLGPHLLTVDASDPTRWRYADLSRGQVLDEAADLEWDLAFRRFQVLVNGGTGFPGAGGVIDLGAVALGAVREVPRTGYQGMLVSGRDTTHALLEDWYSYSFTSHVLRPRERTLALRTARGRHVALRFLSYYCPGAQPGCVTIRYAFVEPAGAGP